MVDSADLGFYGAAWRFTDFCQQLYAGSVNLQFVLKPCELPGVPLETFPVSNLQFASLFQNKDHQYRTSAVDRPNSLGTQLSCLRAGRPNVKGLDLTPICPPDNFRYGTYVIMRNSCKTLVSRFFP